MVELDEATRRALLAREGPPASARAEILAGLRSRLGGPEGPSDPGEPELGGGESIPFDAGAIASAQIAWAAKVVGTTLGLAAAGVLTIKLGAVAVGSMRDEPTPARMQASNAAPQSAAAVEPPEVVDQTVPSVPPSAEVPSEDLALRKPPAATRNQASKLDSPLAAELELVRAAKQLRTDAPEAALAKLDLHGQRFPTGSLAPEREAMRVKLLCVLGRRASCERAGTDHAGAGD